MTPDALPETLDGAPQAPPPVPRPTVRQRLAWALAAGLLAVSGICAMGALLSQGGRFSGALDVATQFAPLWLAGGAGVWLAVRLRPRDLRRRLTQLLALAAVALSTPLIAAEYLRLPAALVPAAGASRPPGPVLNLVQFNAWDLNRDPHDTADWLIAQQADIVVLEEPPDELIAAFKAAGGYHKTCEEGRPQWCRVVILSRMRPLRTGLPPGDNTPLDMPATRATFAASDGGEFTVIGVHLAWPTSVVLQGQQRARLSRLVAASGRRDRIVLAGDFNSTPWSFARRRDDRDLGLVRRTRGLFSWPTPSLKLGGIGFPVAFLPIDHVYAGRDWRTLDIRRGPALGSDHFPILARLDLVDKAGPP